jgi:hypothetical protein
VTKSWFFFLKPGRRSLARKPPSTYGTCTLPGMDRQVRP